MSLLDIHANITYSTIAPLIGMEPISKYTVAAKCPYCGAHAWAIQQDNRNLEEWHYCSQCKASGSIIAMAAERLEMTEVEAVEYFAEQLDTPFSFKDMQAYRKSLDFVQKHKQFWQYASENLRKPTQDQLIYLNRIGWHKRSPMSDERLMNGPAQLYGLADPRVAQKYLKKQFRRREVLAVVPFFRTPTAIGGFACLSPTQDIHTNTGRGRAEASKGEPGFAGLQFLSRMPSDVLVATSMLKNMIQLQMHHFSSSDSPLPIVSWRLHGTSELHKQWSSLEGRQVVIWEREPTAPMLHQAMMCNANISFVGPETKRQKPKEVKGARWKAWVSHDPAIDIWRRIVRTSRPYEQALKNWARLATPQQQVKLLQDAEQYEVETARLVRSVLKPKVSVKVGKKITVGTSSTRERPRTTTGKTTVIERDGKWYSREGRIRLSGVVRVTHVVARPSGHQDYVGFLEADGQKFDFQVPVKKATAQWLRDFGLGNGVYLYEHHGAHRNQNDLSSRFNPFEAAIQFQIPEVVKGVDSVGWDGTGFQFHGAHLENGVFHQNPDFKLPVKAPGPKQNYCRMREEVKTALAKEGKEMSIVWATAIAVCAQVTAPVVELHPFGIWIHRKQCDLFLQTLYNRFDIYRGDYTAWKHRWPRRLDKWHQAIKKDDTGFFVTHYQSQPTKEIQELLVVEANDEDLQPRMITHSADKIVLNYLRHFSQLDHKFPGDWKTWVEHTVAGMHEVFDFVDTAAFRQAPERVKVV